MPASTARIALCILACIALLSGCRHGRRGRADVTATLVPAGASRALGLLYAQVGGPDAISPAGEAWTQLVSAWPARSSAPSELSGDVTIFDISGPAGLAHDGPRHWFIISAETDVLWIRRSEGLTGATRWFGPAHLTADGTIAPRGE